MDQQLTLSSRSPPVQKTLIFLLFVLLSSCRTIQNQDLRSSKDKVYLDTEVFHQGKIAKMNLAGDSKGLKDLKVRVCIKKTPSCVDQSIWDSKIYFSNLKAGIYTAELLNCFDKKCESFGNKKEFEIENGDDLEEEFQEQFQIRDASLEFLYYPAAIIHQEINFIKKLKAKQCFKNQSIVDDLVKKWDFKSVESLQRHIASFRPPISKGFSLTGANGAGPSDLGELKNALTDSDRSASLILSESWQLDPVKATETRIKDSLEFKNRVNKYLINQEKIINEIKTGRIIKRIQTRDRENLFTDKTDILEQNWRINESDMVKKMAEIDLLVTEGAYLDATAGTAFKNESRRVDWFNSRGITREVKMNDKDANLQNPILKGHSGIDAAQAYYNALVQDSNGWKELGKKHPLLKKKLTKLEEERRKKWAEIFHKKVYPRRNPIFDEHALKHRLATGSMMGIDNAVGAQIELEAVRKQFILNVMYEAEFGEVLAEAQKVKSKPWMKPWRPDIKIPNIDPATGKRMITLSEFKPIIEGKAILSPAPDLGTEIAKALNAKTLLLDGSLDICKRSLDTSVDAINHAKSMIERFLSMTQKSENYLEKLSDQE